jgi:putative ABC transport system permease protein
MPALRAQVWAIDRDQPIHRLETARARYADFFDVPRFYAVLMAAFAGIGALLAAVGLYSVLAFAMAQRTKEIGVRLALGAQGRDVVRLVVRQGLLITSGGIALGLLGSTFATRALGTLLIGVGAADPGTAAVVGLGLVAVALVACWVPARRATRVDPIAALRAE